MICVDTNLLIYAHRRGSAENRAARQAIEMAAAHGDGWGIAWPTVTEFWAQVTHPRYPGGASTCQQAGEFLRALVETGGARIFHVSGATTFRDVMKLATDMGVVGPRVFDLQIACAALHAGAKRIWTHDANFVALPGLSVEDPLS